MCHRPLYCSNADDPQHCTNPENLVYYKIIIYIYIVLIFFFFLTINFKIRTGYPNGGKYGIEKLLYDYGVDLAFQAHEHAYERMWPVYNLTVCKEPGSNPYLNPPAPVHIVTGSAVSKVFLFLFSLRKKIYFFLF